MKERPIIFNTEMVKAILEGRKTMTRRMVKPQPHFDKNSGYWFWKEDKRGATMANLPPDQQITMKFDCPFGQPGDRLWVREAFCMLVANHIMNGKRFAYKADTSLVGEEIRQDYIKCGFPYQWTPSIHMPREACRLVLEITNVRVERLGDISMADAIHEGIERHSFKCISGWKNYHEDDEEPSPYPIIDPRMSFETLWQSIYGPESWGANPWVWVVEFRRVEA